MNHDDLPDLDWRGTAVFCAVLAVFLFDDIYGWRALGLVQIAYGCWAMFRRRVPYGLEGQPPMGFVTGVTAVMIGILSVALGLALVVWAEEIGVVLKAH